MQCALADIYLQVSEPTLGQLRLAWWQQAIDNIYANDKFASNEISENHFTTTSPIIEMLGKIIPRYQLKKPWFDTMIAARQLEFTDFPFPNQTIFYQYLSQISGAQYALWADIAFAHYKLKQKNHDQLFVIPDFDTIFYQNLFPYAQIYQLSRILRSLYWQSQPNNYRHRNKREILFLPQDILNEYGLDAREPLKTLHRQDLMAEIIAQLVSEALQNHQRARKLLQTDQYAHKIPYLFAFAYFARTCLQRFQHYHYDYLRPIALRPPLWIGFKLLWKRNFL